jgi:hypothetical protein
MTSDIDLSGRTEQTQTTQGQERRSQDLVRAWAVAAGSLILLGACLYRRIRHPDWTGGQALTALWAVYLAGAVSICGGWLCNDPGMAGDAIVRWRRFLHACIASIASRR